MKRFSDTLSVVETEGVFKPDLECAVTLAENNQASLMVITSAIQVGATGATIIPASGTGAHEAKTFFGLSLDIRTDVVIL